MNKLFIVYTCDANHMNSSKVPLGYFDNWNDAYKAVVIHSSQSEEGVLGKHDFELLGTIKQTQNRSENYIIEEVPLNVLL